MAHRREEIARVLRQRVIAGLHLGVVRPGDRLASVRALRGEFDADPRVILAAYRELELDGLVEVRERSGIYVARSPTSVREMLPQMAGWVVDVLVQALSRGVPAVELPERMRRCLETVRVRAACIECNDDQMEELCGELTRDFGVEAHGVEVSRLGAEPLPEGVLEADLLVTTRFHAAEVEPIAARLGKRMIVVALRPEFVAEARRLLERGPLYFVVKDPRFAAKLPTIFDRGRENLRVSVAGREEQTGIPSDAPVVVMQAARALVGDLSLLGRVVPAPRVFSADTAREILTFVIHANMAAIVADEQADVEV